MEGAFEEGQGPYRAVELVMMMIIIWWSVQIMQFSPACYFFYIRSKYFPQHPDPICPVCFLRAKDLVTLTKQQYSDR
jgi:hypothetical protein